MATVSCKWTQGMEFEASSRSQNTVRMDANTPIGKGSAMTPKELLLAAICGCTAMDVIAMMKKHGQKAEFFEVHASAEMTTGSHPVVFKAVDLRFELQGTLDSSKILESVRLSQTKYCGVSAMVSKASPIRYTVSLNGAEIGSGNASFEF